MIRTTSYFIRSLTLASLLAASLSVQAGLLDSIGLGKASAATGTSSAQSSLAALTQGQAADGLKAALSKGVQNAVNNLGRNGGFLTNLNVKIPMPEKLQTIEKTMRSLGQAKLADDFVATMNHAAEQAVPQAATVFADSIKQMSIEDAKSILSGPSDAATQFFRRTTETNLFGRFLPIVQKSTANAGVTSAYKNMLAKARMPGGIGGALGGNLAQTYLGKDAGDVDSYVTHKAMDGLFKMVAEEEKSIRQNPVARTSDILKKVFGAAVK